MNSRTLFIFAIVGLLFVSSLDAAKAAKGKGKKEAEAKPAEKTKVEKNANPAMGDVVVMEESAIVGEAPTPKIYRPKTLKMVTAYDKCKMECQKIRDSQDLVSYAAQLREELAAAEAAIEAALPQEEAELVPSA